MDTKKYNHAFTLCFSIDTDVPAERFEDIPAEELFEAIRSRLRSIERGEEDSIHVCLGEPYDTYENDLPNSLDIIKEEE